MNTIKSNFLHCHLLWTTLLQVLWPSLWYPLGVTTFSPSQALQLTSQLFQTFLPRLGVNCHFPVALRHVIPSFLGLGIPHPFWEQGICSLQLFLEQAMLSTTESSLIHTSLEYLQLELGSTSHVFDLPYAKWESLASNCWLKLLWCFIDFAQIQLKLCTPMLPPPP